MEQEKFERSKPHINIGTIGHIGHGKTTLTAAITKVLAKRNPKVKFRSLDSFDNAPEEKARAITIAAARVEYETDRRHYAHIDCPGDAGYVKNMIAGAAQMDAAILVVAANEGLKPQTLEHILIAGAFGVRSIVVALNKVDTVADSDQAKLVEMQVRELMSGYDFQGGDDLPVVRVSALGALNGEPKWEDALYKLMHAVDDFVQEPVRDDDGPFLMPIADFLHLPAYGTVVSGRIEMGVCLAREYYEIIGLRPTRPALVTRVEVFQKALDRGMAGDNVELLLRGIEPGNAAEVFLPDLEPSDEDEPGDADEPSGVGEGNDWEEPKHVDEPNDVVERGQALVGPQPRVTRVHLCDSFSADIYVLKPHEGGRYNAWGNRYRAEFYILTAKVAGVVRLDSSGFVTPGERVSLNVDLVAPVAMLEGLGVAMREGGRTVGVGKITRVTNR